LTEIAAIRCTSIWFLYHCYGIRGGQPV
jgi:hypothetical protein